MSSASLPAYHEAGHVVAAYFSRFYNPAGMINLSAYGAGAADVGLSKQKLAAAGKLVDASVEKDPEVATCLATIFAAGLAAERIAERKYPGLRANPAAAAPDHKALAVAAAAAGSSVEVAPYEREATALLEDRWEAVEFIARMLDASPLEGKSAQQLLGLRYKKHANEK